MSYSDGAFIANDATLQGRVLESLISACNNVQTEAITQASLQLHIYRSRLAAQILQAIAAGSGSNWAKAFAAVVGANATCVSDATTEAGGALTSGNEVAACAAITDAHIDNAIASAWNNFLALA